MQNNLIYGLGLYLSDFEPRKNAIERLYSSVSEKRAARYKKRWKKEAPTLTLEQYLSVTLRVSSIETVLAEVINENVFDGKKVVRGVAGALYVPAVLPRTAREKMYIPLEDEVRSVIARYASICYKNVHKKDVYYQDFLTEK